jgi:hypothetical protein
VTGVGWLLPCWPWDDPLVLSCPWWIRVCKYILLWMNIIKPPFLFFWFQHNLDRPRILLFFGFFYFYLMLGVGIRRNYVLVWSNFNLVLLQHIFIALIFQVIHHLLSIVAVAYAMLTGEGQLYTYMVLISETTTPGINLRWYLLFSSDLILKRYFSIFFMHISLACEGILIRLEWRGLEHI